MWTKRAFVSSCPKKNEKMSCSKCPTYNNHNDAAHAAKEKWIKDNPQRTKTSKQRKEKRRLRSRSGGRDRSGDKKEPPVTVLQAKTEPPAGTQPTPPMDLNFPENHTAVIYSPGYIPQEQDQQYYYLTQDNFTGMASISVYTTEPEVSVPLGKLPPLVDDHDLKPISGKALHTVDTLRASRFGRQRMRQEPMFRKALIMEDGCKEVDL